MEDCPPGDTYDPEAAAAESGDLEENGGGDSYEMPPVSGFITVSETSSSAGDLTWPNVT